VEFCCTPLMEGAIGEAEAAEMAPMLAALADPARLRIISMLAAAPGRTSCGCDLESPLGLSQPTVSHHLKILKEAGLVKGTRKGRWVFYSLVEGRLGEIAVALSGSPAPA
jgi:ArsR family transcriptional regulator